MPNLTSTLTFKTETWVAERVRDTAQVEGRSVSNLLGRIVKKWVLEEAGADEVAELESKEGQHGPL